MKKVANRVKEKKCWKEKKKQGKKEKMEGVKFLTNEEIGIVYFFLFTQKSVYSSSCKT